MSVIYVLIPIAILLTAIGIYLFFWAVKTEQFDDLEKQGMSILFDSDIEDSSLNNTDSADTPDNTDNTDTPNNTDNTDSHKSTESNKCTENTDKTSLSTCANKQQNSSPP